MKFGVMFVMALVLAAGCRVRDGEESQALSVSSEKFDWGAQEPLHAKLLAMADPFALVNAEAMLTNYGPQASRRNGRAG